MLSLHCQILPAFCRWIESERPAEFTFGQQRETTASGLDSGRMLVERCQWCFSVASRLSRSRNDKIMPRRGKPHAVEAWSINLHETEGLLTLVADRLWVNGE